MVVVGRIPSQLRRGCRKILGYASYVSYALFDMSDIFVCEGMDFLSDHQTAAAEVRIYIFGVIRCGIRIV